LLAGFRGRGVNYLDEFLLAELTHGRRFMGKPAAREILGEAFRRLVVHGGTHRLRHAAKWRGDRGDYGVVSLNRI
jgi:hypothetical protein